MHLIVTQLALPLLWPNWFTWGENGFWLARSRFDWQPWHWLQRWGGIVIVGGTVGSMAGRGHTHTHIHIRKCKYRHTLSLPLSFADWWSPLLSCPCVPQGRPNLLCHQKLIPAFFSPSLSPNLIISHAIVFLLLFPPPPRVALPHHHQD